MLDVVFTVWSGPAAHCTYDPNDTGLFSERYRKPPRVPLTLGMLEEAMRIGRWDTDAIERAARDQGARGK
ncbi:hypothetical protein DIE06_12930 [Burkholderia sp. Bp8998]|nr:hypothetical protein DIE06_12930 [Burkholderia sp. Bp8998]